MSCSDPRVFSDETTYKMILRLHHAGLS